MIVTEAQIVMIGIVRKLGMKKSLCEEVLFFVLFFF